MPAGKRLLTLLYDLPQVCWGVVLLGLDWAVLDRFDLYLPRRHRRIKRCIAVGCDEETFKAMRCPICGSPLGLDVHYKKDVFLVTCTSHSHHLQMMGQPRHHPPAWWNAYITVDWLD